MASAANPPLEQQLPPVQQQQRQQQEDPAIARLQGDIQRIRGDLQQTQRMVFAQPAPQQAAVPTKQELDKEFIKNPMDMATAVAQNVVNRAVQQFQAGQGHAFDTQVEMAKKLARGDDPERQRLWDKFSHEIDASVAQVDVPLRANTTVWRNAADMVLGKHFFEERVVPPAAGPALHLNDGPQPPSAAAPAPKGGEDKITPEEHKIAMKFRITDAEYMQGKKDNLNQTDLILTPIGPSSWDPHVTFDSRDKRRKERAARIAAAKK